PALAAVAAMPADGVVIILDEVILPTARRAVADERVVGRVRDEPDAALAQNLIGTGEGHNRLPEHGAPDRGWPSSPSSGGPSPSRPPPPLGQRCCLSKTHARFSVVEYEEFFGALVDLDTASEGDTSGAAVLSGGPVAYRRPAPPSRGCGALC